MASPMLVPKAIALSLRERIALQVAVPLHVFSLVFQPVVWLLDTAATLVTRPFGIAPPPAGVAVETESDIRLLVAEAEEAGVIAEAEEEMLYKVFDFADKEVREVMVPRPEIDALAVDCTPADCLAQLAETQLDETESILRFVAAELGPGTYLNLMSQFYPAARVGRKGEYLELDRRIHREEYERALALADELGLRRLDERSHAERAALPRGVVSPR